MKEFSFLRQKLDAGLVFEKEPDLAAPLLLLQSACFGLSQRIAEDRLKNDDVTLQIEAIRAWMKKLEPELLEFEERLILEPMELSKPSISQQER